MLNATMVQAGASISEAAGTTGASYGNSIVGRYSVDLSSTN